MSGIIVAILKRPMVEIVELSGIIILIVSVVSFSVFLILKGVSSLHIKKIGVTGIECEPEPRKSILRRKRSK